MGFASSSFAVTPFGCGTPATATEPPAVAHGARYIDPRTRDWVVGEDGEWQRMPAVRQQVLLAVATIFGSSTVERSRGIRRPVKVGANYDNEMRIAVTNALRFLISSQKIRLLGVTVEHVRPGRALHTISYFDLTLDREDSVVV